MQHTAGHWGHLCHHSILKKPQCLWLGFCICNSGITLTYLFLQRSCVPDFGQEHQTLRGSYSGASEIASSPPGCRMNSPAGLQDSFSLEGRKKTKPASSKAVLAIASSQQEANCLHKELSNSAWLGIFQTTLHCKGTQIVMLWFGFSPIEMGPEGKSKGCEWSWGQGLCSPVWASCKALLKASKVLA